MYQRAQLLAYIGRVELNSSLRTKHRQQTLFSRLRSDSSHGVRISAANSSIMEKNYQPLTRKQRPELSKEYFHSLSLAEKRKLYKCGSHYNTVENIRPWSESDDGVNERVEEAPPAENTTYKANKELNQKVALWQGDITSLEIDAIVNAANRSLLGGGGVDGCIHSAAGPTLKAECATLQGCNTGDSKLTTGHKLPARFVLHTVGPMGEIPDKLASCYATCLRLMKKEKLRSAAFPCVSTGIYGYPHENAAHVALKAVREWLERDDHATLVDRIIFCTFLDVDFKIYSRLLHKYFPLAD